MRIEDKLKDSIRSSSIALSVIGLWFTNLFILLTQAQLKIYIIIPGILLQTFLYTGLFITAHDAMHGTVFPGNRKFNDLIGTLVAKLYAFFSYQRLLSKHW